MINPCVSNEALVEVSNDGQRYSGGFGLAGVEIISTLRYEDTVIYCLHVFVLDCVMFQVSRWSRRGAYTRQLQKLDFAGDFRCLHLHLSFQVLYKPFNNGYGEILL